MKAARAGPLNHYELKWMSCWSCSMICGKQEVISWLCRELSYNKLFCYLEFWMVVCAKINTINNWLHISWPRSLISLYTCHVLIAGKDSLIFQWIYSMCQTFCYLWWILGALEYHGELVVDFFSLWWDGRLQDVMEILCLSLFWTIRQREI